MRAGDHRSTGSLLDGPVVRRCSGYHYGVRLTNEIIKCPAGELVTETIQGAGCRCRITRETLTAVENGQSLRAFCAGKYVECPVWRREKRAIAERKARELHDEIAATSPSGDRPQ